MAIHPTKKLSYVAVTKPSVKSLMASKPVLEVDETSGQVRVLPEVFGQWLAVDPQGQRLFTGLHEMYEDGMTWDAMGFRRDFGHVDIVTSYDLGSDEPEMSSTNEQPGANGRRFHIAPDGRHVAYVAGGGAGGYGYSIAALAADDVSRESSRYQIEAYPTDIAFHPTLNLVACTNGNEVWLFNRRTGEREERLDARYKFQDIERLYFAPAGARLLVAYKHPQRGPVLHAVPIKLNAQEQAAASKGMTSAASTAASGPVSTGDSAKVRTWTDSTGRHRIQAELVGVSNGKAVLKKPSGEIVRVPVINFSEADQQLLRQAGPGKRTP